MKLNTTYDPFGLWAAGPWMLVDLGLQFARTWQEAWLSRMQLGGATQVRLPSLFPSPVGRPQSAPAQGPKAASSLPKMGCLDGVEVVGAPPSVVALPVRASTPAVARPVVAELKQPVEAVVPEPVQSSVTSMLALQARSLSKAVSRAPKVSEAVATKAVSRARKPAAATAKSAAPAAVKPAASAVSKVSPKKSVSKKA